MSLKQEIKPCPFCGIVAVLGVQENDGSEFWITCMVCHANGPKVQVQGMAIHEWNRRRPPTEEKP
jgi:Lar family restriction alleviation protein